MIRLLSLHAFGKFSRRTFDLGPVTVVFGPNEAGKTTFFDGLFQAVCRPGENKKAGKLLKERYGSDRQASAEPAVAPPISDEEFLNLFAVRAGDLHFRLDQGTDWMERLKGRLFHGGLDPAVLVAEFQKRSSDSRTLAVNKELENLRAAVERARRDLEELRGYRERHLADERKVADLDADLTALRARMVGHREEILRLEKDAEREERIAFRRKLAGDLAQWDEWASQEEEARALTAFEADAGEGFREIEQAARSAAESLQASRGSRDASARHLAEARTEARAAREAADTAGPLSALARRLAGEAGARAAQGRPGPGPAGIGLATLILMAGVAGSLAAVRPWSFVSVLVGLAGAAGAVLFSIRWRRMAWERAGASALARWKDEWIAARGDAAAAAVSSLTGFAQAMEDRARAQAAAEERAAEAGRRVEARQADLEAAAAEVSRREGEESAARQAVRDWLREKGVETFAEYEGKVLRAAWFRAELPKRKAALEALAAGDLAAWRSDLLRRLRDLDAEGIPAVGLDVAGAQRLRNRLSEARRDLGKDEQAEKELIDRKAGMAGEIRGALGKLAADIVAAEDRLAEAEAAAGRLEADKRAAGLALSIFKEIGASTDAMLTGLSEEIASLLGRILPQERDVFMTGFEEGRIRAGDAGGEPRPLSLLSTGTQQALALAAKLALARKHRDGSGLLVLDEPFSALDAERTGRALDMVRDFRLRHGWQIILLTKEASLRDGMLARFPDAVVIELAQADQPVSPLFRRGEPQASTG